MKQPQGQRHGARRQQIRRQMNRERLQAQRFRQPLTGKRARHIAKAEAGLQFNPVIRTIRGEVAGSRKREGDIGQWYDHLDQTAQQDLAATTQAQQAAQQATDQRLAAARASDQQMLGDLTAQDAAQARLLGATPSTAPLATIAAGNAAVQQQAAALAAPEAANQAAAARAIAGRREAYQLGGIQAHQTETARRRKLKEDLKTGRKERGAAAAENEQKLREREQKYAIERAAFTKEKPYEQAIRQQAKLGLKGTLASANAQVAAAGLYSGAKRRTATATEKAAEEGRRGHQASARGQVGAAKIYGKNGGGGYNVREAAGLLRSAGQDFPNASAAVDYLVNRGVKLNVAKRAVHRLLSGGGGGGARKAPRPRHPGMNP